MVILVIGLQDCFFGVMDGSAGDVASQLIGQGAEPDISIPIYGVFFLKLQTGEHCRELADDIRQYTEVRKLCRYCGAVCVKINVGDIDLLTLLGAMCVFTPRTGMHVFARLGGPAIDALQDGDIQMLVEAAGIPIPEGVFNMQEIAVQALQTLFDMLISLMQENLQQSNIALHTWDEFHEYYMEVLQSGEMKEMAKMRAMLGLPEF